MTTTTISADTINWLIGLLGAEDTAKLTRPMTPDEQALVDATLRHYRGDVVQALEVHVPADVADVLQSLPVGGAR